MKAKSRIRKPAVSRNDKLSVPIYSLAGRSGGTLSLSKEIFGQKVNKKLLAQAVRVYLTNRKSLLASTKTRGEVEGSTAKIYRQKGTGRARHGSIRAPIFVGGGIVFGPKARKVRLDLPKKMRKAALISALSAKTEDQSILGLSGLDKLSGKTKEIAKLMSSLRKKKQISTLIITTDKMDNVVRGTRNIPNIRVLPVNLVNVYEVLRYKLLLISKEAAEKLGQLQKEKKNGNT
ncbi:50S ribosomal protein L4 [Candidatus Daviesbacteria bacterium]|nr:50S ribosomal protein L4 [Candidatus Daviesbacteria bacterium]